MSWLIATEAIRRTSHVADLIGGKGMVATRYDGLPIAPAHGGPARLLVPHLYFLEERKMGAQDSLHAEGRARLLGVAGISQLR